MMPPPTVCRARQVRRALREISRQGLSPFAQGLDPGLAGVCLASACQPLSIEALSGAVSVASAASLPASVGIVVAHGVFTAPIEWVALYATAGCRVHIKAPRQDPAFCLALADALSTQGLSVTASTGRDLSGLEAIVVFGSDRTGDELRATWPDARLTAFGHRVSAALVDVPRDTQARQRLAQGLARDAILYDGRGCMAPTAVFARGDPRTLAAALHQALAAASWPRGPLSAELGPQWRRRIGLARAMGLALEGPDHAVIVLPADRYLPLALPRLVAIHPLDLQSLPETLRGVPLSSLAVSGAQDIHRMAQRLAPRCCAPGTLQTPGFPRLHDGVDMLGCVLRPESRV